MPPKLLRGPMSTSVFLPHLMPPLHLHAQPSSEGCHDAKAEQMLEGISRLCMGTSRSSSRLSNRINVKSCIMMHAHGMGSDMSLLSRGSSPVDLLTPLLCTNRPPRERRVSSCQPGHCGHNLKGSLGVQRNPCAARKSHAAHAGKNLPLLRVATTQGFPQKPASRYSQTRAQ